jgi:PhnB protein
MKQFVTYLNFENNCRDAMQFYAKGLAADLQLMTYGDMPGHTPEDSPMKDLIMHARLTKGSATLMASDRPPGKPINPGNNFAVSVDCESMEEIQRVFAALAEKGKVTMPLQDQFWGAHFGMLEDQFGIHWMFNYDFPK